jgi:hypothetical protein
MASASKANGSDLPYELPWYVLVMLCKQQELIRGRVEKYRPNVLDDIVGNGDTISRLKVIAKDGNVPHLIISVRPFFRCSVFAVLDSTVKRECRASGKQRAYTVWHISCWEMRTKRACWN